MQRINITEKDNTRPGNITDTNVNIPYIPGMVNEELFKDVFYYTEPGKTPNISSAIPGGKTYKAYNTADKLAWEITPDHKSFERNGRNSIHEIESKTVTQFSFSFLQIPLCDLPDYTVSASYPDSAGVRMQFGNHCDVPPISATVALNTSFSLRFINQSLAEWDIPVPQLPKTTVSFGTTFTHYGNTEIKNVFYDCDTNSLAVNVDWGFYSAEYEGCAESFYPFRLYSTNENYNSVRTYEYGGVNVVPTEYVEPFKANEPIECLTETDFIESFGLNPVEYSCDTKYSDLGFSAPACDGDVFALKGEFDKSYIYARELSHAGLPILYEGIVSAHSSQYDHNAIVYSVPTIKEFYNYLSNVIPPDSTADSSSDSTGDNTVFDALKEKGAFSVKYLTTGGYPTFEYSNNSLVGKMLSVAAERGDCTALIDHTDNYNRSLDKDNVGSVYHAVQELNLENQKFGAMFTPWGQYRVSSYMPNVTAKTNTVKLPASFGYLKSLAQSIRSNPDYLAIAGVARGLVPGLLSLNTRKTLTNSIADSYQPSGIGSDQGVAINAITNIKPYGLTIWGNRTLLDSTPNQGLIAQNYLNTRNMVNNIKKILFTSCQSLMFEQNSDVLWVRFLGKVTPTLDNMQYSSGLSRYKIIRGLYDQQTGQITQPHDGARMYATIKIWPVYAVEAWDITVVLTDEDVEVE